MKSPHGASRASSRAEWHGPLRSLPSGAEAQHLGEREVRGVSTQGVPGNGAAGDLAGLLSAENGAWVESLYEDYVLGRASVPARWREIFDTLASGDGARRAPAPRISAGEEQIQSGLGTFALVDTYRSHGHLIARLDPLAGLVPA